MKLVNTSHYGIKGVNYYWTQRARYGLTTADLRSVCITGPDAYVAEIIIEPLLGVQFALREHRWGMVIKDGHRSPAAYRLVYGRYVERHGKVAADERFNLEDMPHASGLAVDIALYDFVTGEDVWLRDDRDGDEAWKVGFYRGAVDEKGREFQRRQDLLHGIMMDAGFKLGSKEEVWHFEYVPLV